VARFRRAGPETLLARYSVRMERRKDGEGVEKEPFRFKGTRVETQMCMESSALEILLHNDQVILVRLLAADIHNRLVWYLSMRLGWDNESLDGVWFCVD